jgi:hypothetical protein
MGPQSYVLELSWRPDIQFEARFFKFNSIRSRWRWYEWKGESQDEENPAGFWTTGIVAIVIGLIL